MKKENWFYIVIALIAIWIIASYATRPTKTLDESDTNADTGTSTSVGTNISNISGTVTMNPVTVAGVVGMEAGPNKGVLTSTSVAENKLVVTDQLAGGMVKIDSVSLTFNGWVVVRDTLASDPGWAMGAQRFDAGAYSGGQVELLRETMAGTKYYVSLYTDNGDRMFDHSVDLPFESNGQGVVATFIAQ